jgi:hypothetical protein
MRDVVKRPSERLKWIARCPKCWLLAKFSRLGVEIGVPCIERFFLGCEIALETGLTFGNDAPTTGIFVEKDGRYLCAMTIAENDFVRGH